MKYIAQNNPNAYNYSSNTFISYQFTIHGAKVNTFTIDITKRCQPRFLSWFFFSGVGVGLRLGSEGDSNSVAQWTVLQTLNREVRPGSNLARHSTFIA